MTPAPSRSSLRTVALAAPPLLAALLVAHLALGRIPLPPGDVVAALLGRPREAFHASVVVDLRLPRALVGLAAGCLLAVSGALLQVATRNSLAEPGLTGVSAGAALGVVALLAAGGTSGAAPAAAMAGGVAAGALAWWTAGRARSSPGRILLVGALVSALCAALTSALLLGRRE